MTHNHRPWYIVRPTVNSPEDRTMSTRPYNVADVMTKKVVAVAPGAGFKEIVEAMARWKVTALPVLEEEHHVIGVVSEADLLPKEEFHERGPGLIEQMRRLGDTGKAAPCVPET